MHPSRRASLRALLWAAGAGLGVPGVASADQDRSADAPDAGHRPSNTAYPRAASYDEALAHWRSAEHIEGFIGANFRYDTARAMRLSASARERERAAVPAIHEPAAFFAAPTGICVDLSRFAVETLARIDPEAKPRFLMIDFAPARLGGESLRLHWIASFERDGWRCFFADSKRPGHIDGPWTSSADFVAAYAQWRGREVLGFREPESFRRRQRLLASKQTATAAVPSARAEPPAAARE